jgi:hypothetical protein
MKTTINGKETHDKPGVIANWGSVVFTLGDTYRTWVAMTPQEARQYAIDLLQAADRVEERNK